MHANEFDTDKSLVRRLVAAQFPEWVREPIKPVVPTGTDNAIYRLGHDKVVRLPRIEAASVRLEKEHEWLPRLRSNLPLRVPMPVAKGRPSEDYPWTWSIYTWLEGDTASTHAIADQSQAAAALAGFVSALQRTDQEDGPPPGDHNSFRGVPLSKRDDEVRAAISRLPSGMDRAHLAAAWDTTVKAPEWDRDPVWIHGDLAPSNLLLDRGELSAVIDFGCLGVGDPACDLIVAWTLFSGKSRDMFRSLLEVDDVTWLRGRGWALSIALIALPYYLDTNPEIVRQARLAIHEVLSDD